MLDPQLLRTDLDRVAQRLADRGFEFDADAFRALEEERKQVQSRTQELQAQLITAGYKRVEFFSMENYAERLLMAYSQLLV